MFNPPTAPTQEPVMEKHPPLRFKPLVKVLVPVPMMFKIPEVTSTPEVVVPDPPPRVREDRD